MASIFDSTIQKLSDFASELSDASSSVVAKMGEVAKQEAAAHPGSMLGLASRFAHSGSITGTLSAAGDADVGLSPMPLGLVLKGPNAVQNAAKLADMIRTNLERIKQYPRLFRVNGELQPETAEALAFLRAKYPKFSKIPHVTMEEKLGPESLGQQSHGTIKINPDPSLHAPGEVAPRIETLAHETTHSMQEQRTPSVLSNYIYPADPPASFDPAAIEEYRAQYAAYLYQPAEVQARRGGYTAVDAYAKFRNIMDNRQIEKFWKVAAP